MHGSGAATLDLEDRSLPGAQRSVAVRVLNWTHAIGALPLRAAGPPQPSPYNPVAADGGAGAGAERLFVRCKAVIDEAAGIKTFVFAAPEPAGMGKAVPLAYKPGQYASFDFQVGSLLAQKPLGSQRLPCEAQAFRVPPPRQLPTHSCIIPEHDTFSKPSQHPTCRFTMSHCRSRSQLSSGCRHQSSCQLCMLLRGESISPPLCLLCRSLAVGYVVCPCKGQQWLLLFPSGDGVALIWDTPMQVYPRPHQRCMCRLEPRAWRARGA